MLPSLLASLALSKNKNSKASRLIVGPPSFKCYLYLSVWCVCFVCLHHFYRYYMCFTGRTWSYCIKWTYIPLLQVSNFWKEKTLWKLNFWYQWIIQQCNRDSCCEYMVGGVNIYLYGYISLFFPEYAVYLCAYVCDNT